MRFHPDSDRSLYRTMHLASPGQRPQRPAPARGSHAERLALVRQRVREGYYESPAVMHALAVRLAPVMGA